jgi:DNA-binding transcriptional MerR regulator
MSEAGYRGPKVCSIVGITYRQLDYWTRTNLVHASVSGAKGSGTQRLYSYGDLLELKVIKRLLDAGISLQQARKALEALRTSGGDVATANLVLSGTNSVLAQNDDQLVDLLKGGQGVLNIVLPLAGVVEELDAAIHELVPATPDGEAEPEPDDGTSEARTSRAAGAGG